MNYMRYKSVYSFRWVLVIVLLFLIFMSNFIQLKLYFVSISFSKLKAAEGVMNFLAGLFPKVTFTLQDYNLQVITVWFTGIVLGPVFGALTLLIYLLLGLAGLPVFAGGGGIDYFKEPTFGYLLSLPGAAYLAGWLFEQNKKLLTVVLPAAFIHLCGILYMLVFMPGWLDIGWYMSFSMIGYDYIFSLLLLPVMPFLVFLLREICIQEIPVIDKQMLAENLSVESSRRKHYEKNG